MRAIALLAMLVGCSEHGLLAPDGDALGPRDDTGADVEGGDETAPGGDTAGGPDDPYDESGPGGDTDTDSDAGDTDPAPTSDQEICEEAAQTAGYLDSFQTPDDGHVLYCHAGSSGTHYVLVDSDVDSCFAHLAHPSDVFPTTMCDS